MGGSRAPSSPTYDMLVEILGKHVTSLVARSVVSAAVAQCGLEPRFVAARHLFALVPEVLLGTRAFVDVKSYAALERELEEFKASQLAAKGTWKRLLDGNALPRSRR